MVKKSFTKSISFDLTDDLEKRLLIHAEKEFEGKKRNFSRYVKRLIQADMLSGGQLDNPPAQLSHKDDRPEEYRLEV